MMRDATRRWLDEQFAGDAATVALVWDEYLGETTAKIRATRDALAAADYPLLDRLAHTLKGNALVIGDPPLAEAAVALREAARASDAVAAERALARIIELDGENRA